MDLIDKEAALNAHCTIVCGHKHDAICLMECPDYEVFNHLPSAQPTQSNTSNTLKSLDCIGRHDDFEKQIHAMFDHIWDCEIDHPVFQDTVGELMSAVIQCYKSLPSAQPEIIRCNSCKHWTQTIGKMRGFGLGICDFHNAKLVTCIGFCYWAERREGEQDG